MTGPERIAGPACGHDLAAFRCDGRGPLPKHTDCRQQVKKEQIAEKLLALPAPGACGYFLG